MSKNVEVQKKTSIGGQALIEGIMMRGPRVTAMAVRHTSGEIRMEKWPTDELSRPKFWKVPFIRGIYSFVDAMVVGYKCLMRSAEMSGLEDIEEDESEKKKSDGAPQATTAETAGTDAAEEASKATPKKPEKEKEDGFWEKFGMTFITVISSVIGVAVAILLFISLPVFLFNLMIKAAPSLDHQVWRAIIEGLMRILLFVGYISAVSLMKDIHRVFMYHGAEHKTIFCYEKGEELTVENVRRQIRFHPRCGTSFLVLMLLIGIIVSAFIPIENTMLRTFVKLLTFPIVAGIGYELIKLAGRSDAPLVRAISAPGLWLQRITTQEPTDDMIEVAIKAFKEVIPEDPDEDIY